MSNYKGLTVDTSDTETALMVEVAIDWVLENTTLEFDREEELPNKVKLFIVKYCDMMVQTGGVASESLGGMSQTFATTSGMTALLRDLAEQIFGADYKGKSCFIPATSRWR